MNRAADDAGASLKRARSDLTASLEDLAAGHRLDDVFDRGLAA